MNNMERITEDYVFYDDRYIFYSEIEEELNKRLKNINLTLEIEQGYFGKELYLVAQYSDSKYKIEIDIFPLFVDKSKYLDYLSDMVVNGISYQLFRKSGDSHE